MIIFTITSPGKISEMKNERSDGTGFKYVKARLEESYPNNWILESYPTNGNWVTKIHIPETSLI